MRSEIMTLEMERKKINDVCLLLAWKHNSLNTMNSNYIQINGQTATKFEHINHENILFLLVLASSHSIKCTKNPRCIRMLKRKSRSFRALRKSN